jgi:hypothetical protein
MKCPPSSKMESWRLGLLSINNGHKLTEHSCKTHNHNALSSHTGPSRSPTPSGYRPWLVFLRLSLPSQIAEASDSAACKTPASAARTRLKTRRTRASGKVCDKRIIFTSSLKEACPTVGGREVPPYQPLCRVHDGSSPFLWSKGIMQDQGSEANSG